MKKYWVVPVAAIVVLIAIFAYFLTSAGRPAVAQGSATFADGMTISEVRYEDSGAEDGHRLAIMKLKPGTETGLTVALHLNDDKGQIMAKVGEFKLDQACKGEQIKECTFPIGNEDFKKSASLGIAAYKTPGQLMPVSNGRADWDNHRVLFNTKS